MNEQATDNTTPTRRTLSLIEYMMETMNQNVGLPVDVAVVCPSCGTVQSSRDFIAAGVGKTEEEVEPFVGTACIGRYNGAGRLDEPMKQATGLKGCNWTVGGMLKLHTLEVQTPDGKRYPRFDLATPEQAQAHRQELLLRRTKEAHDDR